jgi:membrane protease YdiL (CAAX protease family)
VKLSPPQKALLAELLLVAVMIGHGPFSVWRLVVLLVIASQSIWLRDLDWAALGLRRNASLGRTFLIALASALLILSANRFVILPIAQRFTGIPLDLSALGEPGDTWALAARMLQAWTLAAFGEEMLFRGYLLHRLTDLLGGGRIGWAAAVVFGGGAFGIAHTYQGLTGVIATGFIGCTLGLLYVVSSRNLWPVILCHALVDTIALSAIHLNQGWLVFP